MFSPVEIDFKPQTHAFFAGFQIRLSPLEEKKGPAGERDEEKCARFSARIPRLNFQESITFMFLGRPDLKTS
jgi:hypothetical protein